MGRNKDKLFGNSLDNLVKRAEEELKSYNNSLNNDSSSNILSNDSSKASKKINKKSEQNNKFYSKFLFLINNNLLMESKTAKILAITTS
jgi:hypothetical protein